jgi:hypothetical protein
VHTPSSRCHYGGTSPAVGLTDTSIRLLPGGDRAAAGLLGERRLRHLPAAQHGGAPSNEQRQGLTNSDAKSRLKPLIEFCIAGGRGYDEPGDVPARAGARAVERGVPGAVHPPRRQPLRRQPQPRAAPHAVPGKPPASHTHTHTHAHAHTHTHIPRTLRPLQSCRERHYGSSPMRFTRGALGRLGEELWRLLGSGTGLGASQQLCTLRPLSHSRSPSLTAHQLLALARGRPGELGRRAAPHPLRFCRRRARATGD